MYNPTIHQLRRELNDRERQLSCVRSRRDRFVVRVNDLRNRINDISRQRQSIDSNERTGGASDGGRGRTDYLFQQQLTLVQEESRLRTEVDECNREEVRLELLIPLFERDLNNAIEESNNNNNERESFRYRR